MDKWSWLAGVMDTSCSISLFKCASKFSYSYRPAIIFRRRDKRMLELLVKNFLTTPNINFSRKGNYFYLAVYDMSDIEKLLTRVVSNLSNPETIRRAKLLLEYISLRKNLKRLMHSEHEQAIYEELKTRPSAKK